MIPLAADRDQYVLSLRRKVESTARYLVARLPQGIQADQFDDFVQAGWLGALDAVDKHDAHKGTLEAYAAWRIRGAILDYMRSCDFLKRDHRRKVKQGVEGVNVTKISIDAEIAGSDGLSLKATLEDKAALRPFGSVNNRKDVLDILRRASLPPRYQKMLLEYYWQDKNMKEVGKDLGVNESRISQMNKLALEKARAAAAAA